MRKQVYVLIRIRKSGSQSLVDMVRNALPGTKIYPMPHDTPPEDAGRGLFEKFRNMRRIKRRLWKLFDTTNYAKAWEVLNSVIKNGEVVSGHIRYDSIQMPDCDLKYITVMRDPVMRLYSDYRYGRQSYLKRPK